MMRVELRSRPRFANSHLQQLLHGFENKTFYLNTILIDGYVPKNGIQILGNVMTT